jgi:glyoxylase-like metal-dependent hydrolase (beta-lactamase superfamily II)
MVRRLLIGLTGVVLMAAGFVGFQYYRFVRTETIKVDDRFYVVLGGGGNSTILIADDGVLVVDTKFWRPGRQLPGVIRAITDKPVKVIINTHYHADHTHGNPNYPPGTTVIAHRHTREHLLALDKDFWEVEPAWSRLPSELLDEERVLQFGDETIHIVHPGRGHTDGDVVVYFAKRHILATGDLFFNGRYPRIDLRGGGSGREWPATLDKVLAVGEAAQYVPGHGPLADRATLVRFQSYLRSLVTQVEERAAQGRSLEEIQHAVDLHEYDDFVSMPFLTSRDRNIEWVYEEVTGKKK